MRNELRLGLALCSAAFLSGAFGLGSTRVSAQDPSGQPEAGPGTQVETIFAGTPAYSLIKTESAVLSLSPTAVDAFAPVTLPCPAGAGANGCTFRVSVSSQFWDIPATNVARMNLAITGAGTLGPAALVNVASNTSAIWAETDTMQWAKRNIPAGSTATVTVQFSVDAGTGSAGFRTMSIDVFSGLI